MKRSITLCGSVNICNCRRACACLLNPYQPWPNHLLTKQHPCMLMKICNMTWLLSVQLLWTNTKNITHVIIVYLILCVCVSALGASVFFSWPSTYVMHRYTQYYHTYRSLYRNLMVVLVYYHNIISCWYLQHSLLVICEGGRVPHA